MTRRRAIFFENEGGQSTLEFSLLFPILFTLFFAVVQLVIYFQSSITTQYAAFLAARAYQVYGIRTLDSIGYRHLRAYPYTEAKQTIAEASAEKIIFESLPWEHDRIQVNGDATSMDRAYSDGPDFGRDGVSTETSEGSVRINVKSGQGAAITYCMPILAPGIDTLFKLAKTKYPCRTTRGDRKYTGVAIAAMAQFGVEPEVAP